MTDRNTNSAGDGPDEPNEVGRRRRLPRASRRAMQAALLTVLLGGGAAVALLVPMAAGAHQGAAISGATGSTTGTTTTGTTTATTSSDTTTSTGVTTTTTKTTTSTTTTPATAPGFTTCGGHVTPTPDAADGEPNLLGFSFSCDGQVNSFTVTVDRSGESGGTIDDFGPTATVLAGTTPSATEGFVCEGEITSNGFNCNPQSATKPSPMDAGDTATGTVDLIEPVCKSLPTKAKPGTVATPGAVVSIVVTDPSGYEEGPFTLTDSKRCPSVPNVAPTPKPKPAPKKHHKSKGGKGKKG